MYKGKHGSYIPNTLRGDIAFNSLRKYLIDKEHFVKEANIPLDPIGAYRMLIRGKIESDRCHESADIPLLFYSAQAVHIPNRYEIHKDLNILCDDSDIETIAQKIINDTYLLNDNSTVTIQLMKAIGNYKKSEIDNFIHLMEYNSNKWIKEKEKFIRKLVVVKENWNNA